jgi:hypothetical protein
LKNLLKEKRSETSTELLERFEESDSSFEEASRFDSIDSFPDSWLLQHILIFLENEKKAYFSDVGRMLNLKESDIPATSANQRMKELYGSLRTYLQFRSNIFVVSEKTSHKGVLDYIVSCRRSLDFNITGPRIRSCGYDSIRSSANPFIDTDDEEVKEERSTSSR